MMTHLNAHAAVTELQVELCPALVDEVQDEARARFVHHARAAPADVVWPSVTVRESRHDGIIHILVRGMVFV